MGKFLQKVVLTTSVMAIVAGATVFGPAATQAHALGGMQQVVYLTKVKAGTNKACPVGTKKKFVVSLRVQSGKKITSTGPFTLHLQSGTDLVKDGKQVNNRLVKYSLTAKSRKAKVSNNFTRSYVVAELSAGANPTATVEKVCVSK
ncbi:hypothetical protein KDA14_00845 [Candidatus Saccharibacteria bacterium]|nr:hypothetical protein [Candidatus Saccharibacteria bacterium]